MIYSKQVEESWLYLRYSSVLQKAPTPKCVCFYSGTDDNDDQIVLSLKDSFDGESDIEVKVKMININFGHKLDKALEELPDDSLIKPFLVANKAEVKRMCITEYDELRTLAEQREECRAEGVLVH